MNPHTTASAIFRRTALCVLAVVWASAATRDAAPSPAIQRKIDGLLKTRLRPEPLPINPPNPFQLTTGLRRDAAPVDDPIARTTGTDTGLDRPKDSTGPSDLDVLVACTQKLKLGGVIALKDQVQLVVNGIPRKEGDIIAADWSNTIIQLRVVRLLLSPPQMVLRYNTAEVTVPF